MNAIFPILYTFELLMKRMIVLASLVLACFHVYAQQGCSVKKENFKPIIQTLNPFFTDHQWDSYRHIERARLDVSRSVVIKQTGCKRHHIGILMTIKPSGVQQTDAFFIQETLTLMHMVYFGKHQFSGFKKDFEKRFIEAFKANGVGNEFNFPIF